MTNDMYVTDDARGDGWHLMLGDSCERLAEIGDQTIGLSVCSPPFAQLYNYSPSPRDLSNSGDRDEFFEHYGYIIREKLRVTQPGRLAAVHVMDVPTTKAAHGVIGLTDFSGQVISAYQQEGWVYVARITIRKNPQAAAQRTKAQGLMVANLSRDRSITRTTHPDYLLLFRKPGENAVPINSPIASSEAIICFRCGRGGLRHRPAGVIDGSDVYVCAPDCHSAEPVTPGEADKQTWIRWAEAIWTDINETNTLNVHLAREDDDERHIAPLQLDLIERCILLWSNPGETVLSPFAGIGSEGYVAIRTGRRFVGCELKSSYWKAAVTNLQDAEAHAAMPTLFTDLDVTA